MLFRIFAVLATVLAVTSVPTTANATRPIPGYVYHDQCNNYPGMQPEYVMVGSGRYREDVTTADPNDCIFISKRPFVTWPTR